VAGARRVLVLATQAVRAATNRAEAVAVVEAACGEPVLVLEPEREAELAVLAVGLHHTGAEPHLVVDVGGASTQLIVAERDAVRACRSVPVGSGRLGVYLAHEPPTPDEVAAVQRRIGLAVAPAAAALLAEQGQPGGAVVTGGASKRLARLFATDPPTRLTLDVLLGGFASLLGQPAPVVAERGRIKANRVPMTRVGALILAEVLRAARLVDCIVSPYGIREGAILDAARAAFGPTPEHTKPGGIPRE